MSEETKNIQTDVIGSKNIDSHKDNFQELVDELNKLDTNHFNSFLDIVLKNKQKYLEEMKPIDFLLDWKYEIAEVLCTQKLESEKGNNQALIDKFKDLDFENNKSKLMKVLQNLKVAESTQKIILDDFVNQKGFESLNLEPFKQVKEQYGAQSDSRDEKKAIFLPMQNDFIKLCKVIWRIIKNTETEYRKNFVEYKNSMLALTNHMNFVFHSDTNKNFFMALCDFDTYRGEKLETDGLKLFKDNGQAHYKAFDYALKNCISAYFHNLSRIKCMDTEYTEFANRLDLPRLDRKVVIATNCEQVIADDVGAYRKYNHRPNNKIIMHQSRLDIPERRETRGKKIKKFVLDLLNSIVNSFLVKSLTKKWDGLSQKTKKIILISLFLVFFVLWILSGLNILGFTAFMSLALSRTITIISFIGMMVSAGMFVLLITDDSENVQRDLSNRNGSEIQPNLNLDEIDTPEKNDTNLNLDGTEPKNNLSSGLDK